MEETPENKSIFIERIKQRLLKHNKHFVATVVGATGSGKSYSALRIAECVDPDFTIEQLVFSPADVIRLAKTLQKGSVIILDEAGIGFASRDAMTRQNKTIGKFLQLWRARNLCLISTLPSFDMMDKQGQTLSHCIIRPMSINRAHNFVIARMMTIDHNPFTGVTLKMYMRKRIGDRTMRIGRIHIKKPSVPLYHAYEKYKMQFLDEFNEEAHTKLTAIDEPEVEKIVDIAAIKVAIQANPTEFIGSKSKAFVGDYIFESYKGQITSGQARKIAHDLNNKIETT